MNRPDLVTRIRELAAEALPELIGIRRHLHAYPELSFEEKETAAYIAHHLQVWGIPFTSGWAGHGIVALLAGRGPGPVTALRADMDALPIQELNDTPYRSQRPGIMHACGHDAHMACLLGAARILQELRDHWAGSLKLIFQPAEEKCPGGADAMIREGVLRDPAPSGIFALHATPEIPVGKVGFRAGMFMAAADEIYLTVEGKGGHGAQPHRCVDPVALGATLITTLQQIVSRNSDPLKPCVLSFGKIWSDGGATNVIPDRVSMEGTLRTFDPEWRSRAHALLERQCRGIAESMGGSVRLEIRLGNPPLFNDPDLTAMARQRAVEYLGQDHVLDLDMRMGAEDFANYSQLMPACFWRLGTGPRDGVAPGLHSGNFDILEESLAIGAGLTAWLALARQESVAG